MQALPGNRTEINKNLDLFPDILQTFEFISTRIAKLIGLQNDVNFLGDTQCFWLRVGAALQLTTRVQRLSASWLLQFCSFGLTSEHFTWQTEPQSPVNSVPLFSSLQQPRACSAPCVPSPPTNNSTLCVPGVDGKAVSLNRAVFCSCLQISVYNVI